MDHEKYDMFLADKEYTDWLEYHRPLQKRERTGKEYGCFPFVWKIKMFKWKIN